MINILHECINSKQKKITYATFIYHISESGDQIYLKAAIIFNKFLPRGSLCPSLYGLPKIHKPNLPLQPIIASNKSPTSALRKWLV